MEPGSTAKHDQLPHRSLKPPLKSISRVSPLPLPLPLAALRPWPTEASSSLLSSFVSIYCERKQYQGMWCQTCNGSSEISPGRKIRVPCLPRRKFRIDGKANLAAAAASPPKASAAATAAHSHVLLTAFFGARPFDGKERWRRSDDQ